MAHGRSRRRRWTGIAGSLLILMTLTACGSASSGASLSPGGDALQGGAAAPSAAPGAGQGQGEGSGQTDGGTPEAPRDEAKIVYTGSLDLVVADLDAATSQARSAIDALDGYVGGSRSENDGNSPTATITFRIPAARWDEGVGKLRALATKVVREQTSATEVTGQLVDLEARIRNLRASETALQGIAANAARVTDLLEVQRELTNVRGEIERLDAGRAALVDQTAYGTLETTFGLEIIAVQTVAKGWDPANEVDRASASLVSVLQRLASAGIWFVIVWLPVLLVLGILLAGGVWGLRRLGLFRARPAIEGWPPAVPPAAPPAAPPAG